jgi:hypothetical protein
MENRQYIYQKFEDTTGVNVLSVLPSVTDSNYPCGIFKLLVNVLSTEGKTHNTFTKSLKITTVVIRI